MGFGDILLAVILTALKSVLLLVCLAAVFMGMLNARGRFFVPAMGATTLNLVMIASVFWLAPRLGTEIHEQVFALAIGVVLVLLTERLVAEPALRLLVVVGFLGGYTTFSSFTFETLALLEAGDWLLAGWYVVASNGVGLLAVFAGAVLARAVAR